MRALADRLSALDGRLMAVPARIRGALIGFTILTMLLVSLPHVPRSFVDYSRRPWLSGIAQPESFEHNLVSSGSELVYSKRFADHHRFTQQEVSTPSIAAKSGRRK